MPQLTSVRNKKKQRCSNLLRGVGKQKREMQPSMQVVHEGKERNSGLSQGVEKPKREILQFTQVGRNGEKSDEALYLRRCKRRNEKCFSSHGCM